MTCIFCQIAADALPSALVYRDEYCTAFMDVHPLGQGHVLLIPQAHVEKLEQLPTSIRQHLYQVFDTLLAAQRRAGFGVEGTHLIVNDGKATNQHIPHAHLHLVPRRRGDALGFGMRMFMHFTGVFGRRTPLETLRRQALLIAAELDPQTLDRLAQRVAGQHSEVV
ncbi:HIT family protein [Pseudomonas mandelii]|uniref:HIT family protein n=1 Tax=Pseudomonas mandelii TaxID=75612 RepID=UPI00209EFB37|nr:HIT family protein [Pseudomonas mandelii]MCO8313926.1 HIT family protein [Pseudomonas mandelii]